MAGLSLSPSVKIDGNRRLPRTSSELKPVLEIFVSETCAILAPGHCSLIGCRRGAVPSKGAPDAISALID